MKILIIGISSDIAYQTCLLFAQSGNELFCTSRSLDSAKRIVDDIKIRTNNDKIYPLGFEPNEISKQTVFFDDLIEKHGLPDLLFIAYGSLPNNDEIKDDFSKIIEEFNTNFVSVGSIVTFFASKFTKINEGTIAVISSVAGDRARGSNYIYGTAKGALSLFLQGIRANLSSTNIKVITIKPGFVSTKMTSHLPQNFLFAKPDKVAKQIYDGIRKGKDVIYTPSFWFIIMFIIKLVPERIFKKLKF